MASTGDHSTVHRWAIKLLPVLEKAFRHHKRPVGRSWRVDETYIKVKGPWKYLYRAVDKAESIDQNGEPETVTIDKSGANLAALEALNTGRDTPISIRQTSI
ncbi:IS6 family transposase ISBmu21 [Paraburkholderia aspalathi]|nr:IS6 family transposase ISBmu21 [Paraburkholderia aspalathi]